MKKLEPFCVECKNISANEAQELLNLAVRCGGHFKEAVFGADNILNTFDIFPIHKHNSFKYVGISSPFLTTFISDNLNLYKNNILSYEEALQYLNDLKKTQCFNIKNA